MLVTLRDGERELRGRAVLVATGSRPAHPQGIPFDDPTVFDTDRIFTLDRLPAHAVIVGGGPAGVEFATVFAALGALDDGERGRALAAEHGRGAGGAAGGRPVHEAFGWCWDGAERVGRVDGRA